MPGPRRARNLPTGVSASVAASSSIRLSPTSTAAASTPCSETVSRCSSSAPNSRPYVSIAASRSRTATATWWIPFTATPAMLSRPYFPGVEDAVHEAVLDRLLRRHEAVAVDVLHHLLDRTAGVPGDDLGHAPSHLDELVGGDLDVRRRSARARRALVDHHLRVRQAEALAGGAARQDHGRRRHAHAEADRAHVRLDVLHRVVDGHARISRSAWRVDVELDVLVRVLGLEEQKLGGDQVGGLVLHLGAEEDDPLAEQPRVEVERALEAAVGLDDDGD